jgi:hypothetical protein
VRALTHTYACTNPNTQMHTHIHALHAYNGDTHIHAHITHMQTQVVGGRKGIRACGIFEKLNDNVCLNGSKALRANPDTNTVVITRVHDQSSSTAAKRIP